VLKIKQFATACENTYDANGNMTWDANSKISAIGVKIQIILIGKNLFLHFFISRGFLLFLYFKIKDTICVFRCAFTFSTKTPFLKNI